MESLDAPDAFAFLDVVGDLRELDDPHTTRILPSTRTVLRVFESASERIVEAVEGTSSPKEET